MDSFIQISAKDLDRRVSAAKAWTHKQPISSQETARLEALRTLAFWAPKKSMILLSAADNTLLDNLHGHKDG